MIHFAHIAPLSVLQKHLFSDSFLYHMALAFEVLHNEKYRSLYQRLSLKGRYIILDNSLWELGHALRTKELINAVKAIGASEVVATDVFRNNDATRKKTQQFIEIIRSSDLPVKIQAVAQGYNEFDWVQCFDWMNTNAEIDTIALPKVLDDFWHPGGRLGAISFLESSGRVRNNKAYHLLGIWSDPIEVLYIRKKFPWIRSIDSALPIHAALSHIVLNSELGLHAPEVIGRPHRPKDYFNIVPTISQEENIVQNIRIVAQWCGLEVGL